MYRQILGARLLYQIAIALHLRLDINGDLRT
jgi:hypothetical protein